MQEQTSKILSKSANDIIKALNSLKQVSSNIEEMSNEVTNLDYQISEREAKLKEMEVRTKEMERQLMVELDLKVKEGMIQHLNSFLTATGSVAIDKQEYNDLLDLKRDYQVNLNEEKKRITEELHSKYIAEQNLKIAQINAERAEDKAKLSTLETRLVDATKAAETWREQLEAERAASVERQKASSIGTINVSGAGK